MIEIIEDSSAKYNRKMSLSGWQFSAAALGIVRFLDFAKKDYEIIDEDVLLYKYEDINLNCEGQYVDFIEEYFDDRISPVKLSKLLEYKGDLTEDEEKIISELLRANTVSRRVFKGYKYPENSREELLSVYQENREALIKETFKYALLFGYRKFLNENLMGTEKGIVSRLSGYSIDKGRKIESLSFNWNAKSFVSEDATEFDYIPFAFSKSVEAFFINNNFEMIGLKEINDKLNQQIEKPMEEGIRPRKELFFNMGFGSEVAINNVEIIKKDSEKDYYETIYLRKTSVDIFKRVNELIEEEKEFKSKKAIPSENKRTPLEMTLDSYVRDIDLNIMEVVTDKIVNNLYLDSLIELLLKESNSFLVGNLIKINKIIYEEVSNLESKNMKRAYASAKEIVSKLSTKERKNKITSYRQKLISCLIMHDYDRFNETLLQLSSYAGVEIGFAYDLFENFEENKNVAYAFVNTLNDFSDYSKNKGESK